MKATITIEIDVPRHMDARHVPGLCNEAHDYAGQELGIAVVQAAEKWHLSQATSAVCKREDLKRVGVQSDNPHYDLVLLDRLVEEHNACADAIKNATVEVTIHESGRPES